MKNESLKSVLLLTPRDVQIFIRDKYHAEVPEEKIIPGEIRAGSRQLPIEVIWQAALSEDKTIMLDFDGEQTDWPEERFCKISSGAAYILKNGSHIRYDGSRRAFVNKVEFNVHYSRLDQHLVESL